MMRRLFGQGQGIGLESLDLPGWTIRDRGPDWITRVNDIGEVVQLRLIARPAWLKQMDVAAALADLRTFAEQRQAGAVSLESFTNAAFPCLQFIDKSVSAPNIPLTRLRTNMAGIRATMRLV